MSLPNFKSLRERVGTKKKVIIICVVHGSADMEGKKREEPDNNIRFYILYSASRIYFTFCCTKNQIKSKSFMTIKSLLKKKITAHLLSFITSSPTIKNTDTNYFLQHQKTQVECATRSNNDTGEATTIDIDGAFINKSL